MACCILHCHDNMFSCIGCHSTALSFMRGKHNFHIVRTAPNGQLQRPVNLSPRVFVAYMCLRSSCRNKLQRRLAVCTPECSKASRSTAFFGPKVRASLIRHSAGDVCLFDLLACCVSFVCLFGIFIYVKCRHAHFALHVQPVHFILGAL